MVEYFIFPSAVGNGLFGYNPHEIFMEFSCSFGELTIVVYRGFILLAFLAFAPFSGTLLAAVLLALRDSW